MPTSLDILIVPQTVQYQTWNKIRAPSLSHATYASLLHYILSQIIYIWHAINNYMHAKMTPFYRTNWQYICLPKIFAKTIVSKFCCTIIAIAVISFYYLVVDFLLVVIPLLRLRQHLHIHRSLPLSPLLHPTRKNVMLLQFSYHDPILCFCLCIF